MTADACFEILSLTCWFVPLFFFHAVTVLHHRLCQYGLIYPAAKEGILALFGPQISKLRNHLEETKKLVYLVISQIIVKHV